MSKEELEHLFEQVKTLVPEDMRFTLLLVRKNEKGEEEFQYSTTASKSLLADMLANAATDNFIRSMVSHNAINN